jgi:hypothetical protein
LDIRLSEALMAHLNSRTPVHTRYTRLVKRTKLPDLFTCQSVNLRSRASNIPQGTYEGSNFVAASFQEREGDDTTTESACLTSAMRAANVPEFTIAAKNPKRIISGVSFLHGISTSVGLGLYERTDLYRTFHKGICYELSFSIATNAFENFDPGTVKEVIHADELRVRGQLTAILDSFRFLK